MKPYLKPLFAAAAVLSFSTAAFAADEYTIDSAHTWVNFAVNHGGFASARGDFGDVSGTIMFDADNVTESSVSAVIKVGSIDTNNKARDGHLASPDFFNAAEFPTLTFKSTSIEKTGDNTGIITGTLTMAGMSKPVSLDTTFNQGTGDKVGFSATAEITPGDFGMAKVAGFGMGPSVHITIDVEAKK